MNIIRIALKAFATQQNRIFGYTRKCFSYRELNCKSDVPHVKTRFIERPGAIKRESADFTAVIARAGLVFNINAKPNETRKAGSAAKRFFFMLVLCASSGTFSHALLGNIVRSREYWIGEYFQKRNPACLALSASFWQGYINMFSSCSGPCIRGQ